MSFRSKIPEECRIPAGHGAAFTLSRGDAISIVNTYGNQVADIWAFRSGGTDEYVSMDHTRSSLSRIVPRVGDALVSNKRRPLLRLEADTSPGVHDTLLCPCNAALYDELGAAPGHRSCEGNLHEALAAVGATAAFTPASFNAFMNVAVAADRGLVRGDPVSGPGDAITLRAVDDVTVVVSACPQDITTINGADRSPRPLDVLLARADGSQP